MSGRIVDYEVQDIGDRIAFTFFFEGLSGLPQLGTMWPAIAKIVLPHLVRKGWVTEKDITLVPHHRENGGLSPDNRILIIGWHLPGKEPLPGYCPMCQRAKN